MSRISVYEGCREPSGYPRVTKDSNPFASPMMVGIKHGHPMQWEWHGPFPMQGQLALGLLLEVLSHTLAIALHQAFAWEVVQHFDSRSWRIDTGIIAAWAATYLRDHTVNSDTSR
jgi:hypothetical protein